jgi:AcrR family transcriptional regulator
MSTRGTFFVGDQLQQPSGLRERKKALTRATIEARALERFLDEGYEQVRLEDICADSLVSLRTFFRYFTSKEDLVLGRLRSHLDLADDLFTRRPADEPLLASLHAVINRTVADYGAEPERELTRLRLAAETPVLEAGLSAVFTGFERLVRRVAAARLRTHHDTRAPRLVAAAAVAAFRVGLEMWVESDARLDLSRLVLDNLDDLTAGVLPAGAPHTEEPRPTRS